MVSFRPIRITGNVGGGWVKGAGWTPGVLGARMLTEAQVPILLTNEDTYTVSAKVGNLVVKIGPNDQEKVDAACKLIEHHIDSKYLTEALGI